MRALLCCRCITLYDKVIVVNWRASVKRRSSLMRHVISYGLAITSFITVTGKPGTR